MSLEDRDPISLANLERSLSYHRPSFQHSGMEMRPFYSSSNSLNNGNSKQKTKQLAVKGLRTTILWASGQIAVFSA